MAVTAKTTTASVEERVPLRGMRRKIAERMVKSRNTAAQVTHVDEIDMTEVVQQPRSEELNSHTCHS
jgi:pyruvate dehydrogenase E2 component (dihydrolipoamide acetyltransferase)